MTPRLHRSVVLALTATLVVGCAAVHNGTAIRDPRNDPRAVNTALLDPGDYPTAPHQGFGVAGSPEEGAGAEGRRLAEAVVVPSEVDLAWSKQVVTGSGPFTDPTVLINALSADVAVAIQSNNFLVGFQSEAGSVDPGRTFTNIVLRFATPEDAVAAGRDMAAGSERGGREVDGDWVRARRALPVPDRPGTVAFLAEDDGFRDLYLYTPYGPYVLVQVLNRFDSDTATAVAMAFAIVDRQRAALDRFTTTPVEDLPELPMDPTGLLARSLPGPSMGLSRFRAGVYEPHGALHFMPDPISAQQLFRDAALVAASVSVAMVFQTRGATGADELAEAFISDHVNQRYGRGESIPGLSASRCLVALNLPGIPEGTYYCVVTHDRYVITAQMPTAVAAHQAVSAQYLLLSAE